MKRLFGTDGVRGIANSELDPVLAFRLAKYGARVLRQHHSKGKAVLIAHDGRISADMLIAALSAGFCSEGLDVYNAGKLPTPGLAALTKLGDFTLGVMVSASHNGFKYNGIKFFNHEGFKLSDAIEDEIQDYVDGRAIDRLPPVEAEQIGRIFDYERADEIYMEYLLQQVRPAGRGLRVALDCANGATEDLADRLFQAVGCEIAARLGCEGNGLNINDNCGSTKPERLSRAVKATKADLGLAFDGDGDRLICIDRRGNIVSGDQVMAILSLNMKNKGELADDTLVITIMSNLGLQLFAKKHGINMKVTKVGDRYVLEEMLKNKFNIGGEQSGHIILRQHQTTGDGLLSALALIDALNELELDLAQAETLMPTFPQVQIGVEIPNQLKEAASADEDVRTRERQWMEELKDEGRIVLRASGTEPLVRVMVEAKTQEKADEVCRDLADLLRVKYSQEPVE